MKFNFEINKNLNNLLLQLVVLIQFKIKENLTKEELWHPSNIFNTCPCDLKTNNLGQKPRKGGQK